MANENAWQMIVQGEGGFRVAPACFFEALMQRCHSAGVAVWLDEIQTFGRNGGIARLSRRIDVAFDRLMTRMPGVVTERSGLGAMQAFVAWDGEPSRVRDLIEAWLEEAFAARERGSRRVAA